ncbi:hypothetical protein HMF8227_02181 [Saliniradius amylolyticus]|uniref:Uncharacterized protein n=1 Tax=Saliniradius amylolyticus TaxID=2183582 RepID=A0A2S2E4W5_9ALTE|nr:transporter substrate-binding domain-containing protein [Saliniradius amylolyticus]AWL12639.1 hypothetical protein HMF8227_02181 [Saliniradius amylolyticus]
MKFIPLSLIACSLCLGWLFGEKAQASVTVSAPILPGVLDRAHGEPGPYNILLNRIISTSEQRVEVLFSPSSRASKYFLEGQAQCLLPASHQHLPDADASVVSEPFNKANIYIFSAEGAQGYKTLSELAGLRVSMRRGYLLNKAGVAIPDSVYFVRVNSIEQSIGLMDHRRIDAFIAYTPDAFAVFKQSGRTEFVYHPGTPLTQQSEHVVCHDTPANRKFIEDVNQVIQQVLAEKQFAKALAELEQGAAVSRSE